jgi:hypothetical protein
MGLGFGLARWPDFSRPLSGLSGDAIELPPISLGGSEG